MSEDIVARLERIEQRLDALEARNAEVRPPAVPRQPAPPVYYQPRPTSPRPAIESEDLETLLGSRWLPRAGALAIVAAVAYLVALGLQRGLITPVMVVSGIGIVCLLTIGLGLRLKDERAAFGHVLVGLGTAGLYVDVVGAHFYQNLMAGPPMVGLCLAISLASLGYGFWRALPSFLAIGLSGGLTAALMPLDKGDTATSIGLLLLVTLPAFAVGAGRRWPAAIAATWIASFLACLPILLGSGPMTLRLLPIDAILLIALAAWSVSSEKAPASDPPGLFAPVAAVITGASALGAYHGQPGALHILGLGVATAAIGALLRSRETGQRVLLAGALLACTVAPFGLQEYQISFTLALISLAAVAVAIKVKWIERYSVFQCALALATYFVALLSVHDLPVATEAGLIVLLLGSAVANALVMNLREMRAAAGVVAWALLTRLAVIGLDLPLNAAITLAWIVICAGLLIIGFVRQLSELRQLGLVVAAATACKVVLVDLAGLDSALKAALLMVLGLVLLTGGYAYVRREKPKGNLGG